MNKLRILTITDSYAPYPRGGAEGFAQDLAERCAQRGHHVDLITKFFPYTFANVKIKAARDIINGVRIHRAMSCGMRVARWTMPIAGTISLARELMKKNRFEDFQRMIEHELKKKK